MVSLHTKLRFCFFSLCSLVLKVCVNRKTPPTQPPCEWQVLLSRIQMGYSPRKLHSRWCPLLNNFKFQLCNQGPARTQRLWFPRHFPVGHGNNAPGSLGGIVYGRNYNIWLYFWSSTMETFGKCFRPPCAGQRISPLAAPYDLSARHSDKTWRKNLVKAQRFIIALWVLKVCWGYTGSLWALCPLYSSEDPGFRILHWLWVKPAHVKSSKVHSLGLKLWKDPHVGWLLALHSRFITIWQATLMLAYVL